MCANLTNHALKQSPHGLQLKSRSRIMFLERKGPTAFLYTHREFNFPSRAQQTAMRKDLHAAQPLYFTLGDARHKISAERKHRRSFNEAKPSVHLRMCENKRLTAAIKIILRPCILFSGSSCFFSVDLEATEQRDNIF